MNNYELAVRIEECLASSNVLNCIEELFELRKIYKDSDFYKKTKLPFEQCVEMYGKVVGLQQSRRSLTEMIEDYILNLDMDKIQSLMNRFAAQFEKVDFSMLEEVFANLTKNLDYSELREKIKEFEELNNRASNL